MPSGKKTPDRRSLAGKSPIDGANCLVRGELPRANRKQDQLLPGHDGNSNLVYDEAGTVHCYDRASAPMVWHRMSDIVREPAMHEELVWRQTSSVSY